MAVVRDEALRSLDPLRLMAADPSRFPVFFESTAQAPHTGQLDLLPIADGRFIALGSDGCVRDETGAVIGNDFADALDAAWLRGRSPSRSAADDDAGREGPPFRGGWVLYLGYEAAAQIERAVHMPAFRGAGLPVALAIRAPAVWSREHGSGRVTVATDAAGADLPDLLAAAALAGTRFAEPTAWPRVAEVHEDEPLRFVAGVQRVIDYLRAGDVFQVNLSRGWQARFAGAPDPLAVYRRLRSLAPAPFSGLLRWGATAVISASPERLVRVRGRCIDTRPIAGTRPRGADPAADAALRAELIAHPKERAEHVMLIDLERNDLGRVCTPGSIRVDELMSLESYAHVHHIVSNVSGELRAGTTPGAILRALFPGGTITGCPKVRCMQIIAELEGEGRGPYTGAMGYLDVSGDMDLNILIRSAWLEGDRFGFRAGAGIVVDSVAERELAETRAKTRGMLALLGR